MNTKPEFNDQGETVDITGVVVHARPDAVADVSQALAAMRGVEVHAAGDDGKLVVTIDERAGEKLAVDTLTAMAQLPGVIATSLVYHYADSESNLQESTDEVD